jgi:MoaA/NifB/PqqE/SkfB family radical SAM enzyme
LSIQGGEPTIHQGFYEIINGVRNDSPIDLLTNLQFTTDEFKSKVHPNRIRRESPYPSVRVSYHPQMMDLDRTIEKILNLQNAGYSIGLFGVMHPEQEDVILSARERCRSMGIDFRVKDFLGHYQGKLYGDYCYPEALDGQNHEPVMCRNSEMLIDPSGFVFRCHHDVYNGINPIGHILDPELNVQSQFRPCTFLGRCNPCDIKLKTNRFQQFGHCSVEITGLKKNISEKQFAQAIHT